MPDSPQKKQEASLVVASEESDLVRLPGPLSLLPNAELLAMGLFSALRSIVLLYWSIHVLCTWPGGQPLSPQHLVLHLVSVTEQFLAVFLVHQT